MPGYAAGEEPWKSCTARGLGRVAEIGRASLPSRASGPAKIKLTQNRSSQLGSGPATALPLASQRIRSSFAECARVGLLLEPHARASVWRAAWCAHGERRLRFTQAIPPEPPADSQSPPGLWRCDFSQLASSAPPCRTCS